MLRSNWRIIVAVVVGLILAGILGATAQYLYQAAEQHDSQYNYQPASHPSRLVVGTSKSPAKPYQPNCDNPQSNGDADLCAQWAAVQQVVESNRLTSLNTKIAVASLLATFAATGLLIWTLMETRWTARRQLRAYVHVFEYQTIGFGVGNRLGAKAIVYNKGQTPAHDVQIAFSIGRRPVPVDFKSLEANFSAAGANPLSKTTLASDAPMQSTVLFPEATTETEMQEFSAGLLRYFVYGKIRYEDIFGVAHESEFRAELNDDGVFRHSEEGNRSN